MYCSQQNVFISCIYTLENDINIACGMTSSQIKIPIKIINIFVGTVGVTFKIIEIYLFK